MTDRTGCVPQMRRGRPTPAPVRSCGRPSRARRAGGDPLLRTASGARRARPGMTFRRGSRRGRYRCPAGRFSADAVVSALLPGRAADPSACRCRANGSRRPSRLTPSRWNRCSRFCFRFMANLFSKNWARRYKHQHLRAQHGALTSAAASSRPVRLRQGTLGRLPRAPVLCGQDEPTRQARQHRRPFVARSNGTKQWHEAMRCSWRAVAAGSRPSTVLATGRATVRLRPVRVRGAGGLLRPPKDRPAPFHRVKTNSQRASPDRSPSRRSMRRACISFRARWMFMCTSTIRARGLGRLGKR